MLSLWNEGLQIANEARGRIPYDCYWIRSQFCSFVPQTGENNYVSQHSSVSTVTRLWAGRPVQGIFLFSAASRPALKSTPPPIHWVTVIKRPGRETDHSPPSSSKLNAWSYTSSPSFFMTWCLVKYRDKFTLMNRRLFLAIPELLPMEARFTVFSYLSWGCLGQRWLQCNTKRTDPKSIKARFLRKCNFSD
jgi:hypothetical protein